MRIAFDRVVGVLIGVGVAASQLAGGADPSRFDLERRVAAQRAIEAVHWSHRIWPESNPGPKPPLESVLPASALEEKVIDGLRYSSALARYWSHPLTNADLEQEMRRMARNSKAPEVLAELHAALGNDPVLIAETLARPALASRLVRNWYARDPRFHGELRRQAEAALAAADGNIGTARPLAGRYEEVEWVRGENSDPGEREAERPVRIVIPPDAWDSNRTWLNGVFGIDSSGGASLPVGRLSPLAEDADRFFAVSILVESADRIAFATVAWDKVPFSQWWSSTKSDLAVDMSAAPGPAPSASSPEFSAGSECLFDTWSAMPEAPTARQRHTAVWTGSEMLVWGGYGNSGYLGTGYRYNAATDTWYPMSTSGAPAARERTTSVWSGSEFVIWGGYSNVYGEMNTGGRYDPATDSWRPTSMVNVPGGRTEHTAVWTGSEMIIWGGGWYRNDGGRYNPFTDTWITMPSAPDGRHQHTAVWTGAEMIVWGGYGCRSDGDRFNPASSSWTRFSGSNNPGGRYEHVAVWTGQRMLVWGGECSGANGGLYNPATDSWTTMSTTSAPSNYRYFPAVWTGTEFLVWSGYSSYDAQGGRYDPTVNQWRRMSTSGAPLGRYFHSGIWTGGEFIVWGGYHPGYGNLGNGGRYNPAADTWIPTSADTQPSTRQSHTAVWTGSELIVWGGAGGACRSDGAMYIPAGDIWEPTSDSAIDGRHDHTAVWTGTEMIVWGGNCGDTRWATGSRYDPMLNSWTATTTTGAPRARTWHTAVWDGSRMIVWGGHGDKLLNSGGRYDPSSNSWTPADAGSAPTPRAHHTALWTGNQMVVWGGDATNATGGRYDPLSNTWTPTSLVGAPSPRQHHTAVWSGDRMLIWGGAGGGTNASTGGIYDPAADAWAPMTSAGAPQARSRHVSVWADRVMLVWGGYDGSNELATGGKYIPAADTWQSLGRFGGPTRRVDTAAATGGEFMYVWGGYDAQTGYLSNGARYCACNDTDATCDALDQDCDGIADDEYPVGPTTCGVGACERGGLSTCIAGVPFDTCVPGEPASDDSACNGTDDDCDHLTDEEYPVQSTSCGVGACYRTGATSCVAGEVLDSCVPGDPAAQDPTCDGIDDDCDGSSDDEYTPVATECGVGACFARGVTSCSAGTVQDSCTPGPPAPIDNTCNGIDDDCSGSVDEEFTPQAITCGVGACLRQGATSCSNGVLFTDCTPGSPAASDTTCNAVDDDCSGAADEDYVPQPTTCGVGACLRGGHTTCVAGAVGNDCVPGLPAANDGLCNGIDDDCDGAVDDDFVDQPTSCGVGACQSSGTVRCVDGALFSDCTPGAPGSEQCANGVDDDCDGLTDANDPDCIPPPCVDDDGDGYAECGPCQAPDGVACTDCDDSNAAIWRTPSEVRMVVLAHVDGTTTIDWATPDVPGAIDVGYDVLRSDRPDDFENESRCLETSSSDRSAQDMDSPAPNEPFFYLIRAANACPNGVGPLGSGTGGFPRFGRTCP